MSTESSPFRRTVHVVALALVHDHPEHGRRLFIARRTPGRRHGGLWELPGGQVEPGETERDAIVREIREELDIGITLDERLGEATVATGPIDVRMVVFVARQFTGTPTLVDHDASRWVTAPDLAHIEWAPADIPHLPALVALFEQ